MSTKCDITKLVRKTCRAFEPYVAGKPVETIKRELKLKSVIKLASNENPLGPSKKAIEAIKKSAERVYFYPDSNSFDLRKALADKFKVGQKNIMLGCGSDELIEIIAKAFFNPGDEIIVSEHAFIRYEMAGRLMNAKVISVPMSGYTHDLNAMASKLNIRTKAVFIANPNNPTGTYNTKSEFEAFLKKLSAFYKKSNSMPLVILDEAYYEYASVNGDYPQSLEYLDKFNNLIILRTFSKIYGLAGLRVGYGFASEEVTDFIERIRPPFNISIPAQAAAIASLSDTAQVSRSLKLVQTGKKYLFTELKKLKLHTIPTAGNFILIKLQTIAGREIFKKLLSEGVIVRAMDEYAYPQHIRVTVGTQNENRVFIKALKKIIHS